MTERERGLVLCAAGCERAAPPPPPARALIEPYRRDIWYGAVPLYWCCGCDGQGERWGVELMSDCRSVGTVVTADRVAENIKR